MIDYIQILRDARDKMLHRKVRFTQLPRCVGKEFKPYTSQQILEKNYQFQADMARVNAKLNRQYHEAMKSNG